MKGVAVLGLYIRQLREKKGWSLRILGSHAGISHTQIDILEKGYDPRTGKRANTTMDTLQKVADALEVNVQEFVRCLSGGMEVTLTRPRHTWYPDEEEDVIHASDPEIATMLILRYGRARVAPPAKGEDNGSLREALFGYTPTEDEWQQVLTLVKKLKEKRG